MMPRVEQMFHTNFEKPVAEVKAKVIAKVEKIKQKIEERIVRVKNLRAEHGIDDAALIELLTQARNAAKRNNAAMQYSYTSNAPVGASANGTMSVEKTIGAGVVNHLMTENDFIESERDEVKRLELYARNVTETRNWDARRLPGELPPVVGVHLSYDELEYLGY